MDETMILNVVTNIQRVFAIVLALALAEAFKQLVSDNALDMNAPFWERRRIIGFFTFLLLLVPFFQGMNRYFYGTYAARPLRDGYQWSLAFDAFAFLVVSSLFFFLSRALAQDLWTRLTKIILSILVADSLWGVKVWLVNTPEIINWLCLNGATIAAYCCILEFGKKYSAIVMASWCLGLMFIRTSFDYYLMWDYFFP